MKFFSLVSLFFLAFQTQAQIRITGHSTLPLPPAQQWHQPRFSPDGGSVYLTNSSLDGIWRYERLTSRLTELTRDRASGDAYTLSEDGRRLSYRRTSYQGRDRRRLQEIVVMDVKNGSSRVTGTGEDLSEPLFDGDQVLYAAGARTKTLTGTPRSASVYIIGTESGGIAIVRNGAKSLLNPISGGSYIWPSLSPDRTRLAARDIRSRTTFVCTLDGTIIARLGRGNAPVWTRDGQWIICMEDKDNGHRITGSELVAIRADGSVRLQLTRTSDVAELFPSCSPVENKIICSTTDGRVLQLTYEAEP